MSEFRLSASKYLITWPQSDGLSMEEIMETLEQYGEIKYAVVCEEHHLREGMHHHAAVIYHRNLNRRRNVFNIRDFNCNVEVIGRKKIDVENAIKYVKKDGVFIWKGLEPRLERALEKREKLEYAINHTVEDCVESGAFSISEICKIPQLKMITMKKRDRNKIRRVLWFYGATGSGKTRKAIDLMTEKYEDEFWISSGDISTFKNGYKGEFGAVIDDLRAGDIKFNDLLRLLDRYRYTVNVKGGAIEWNAEDIIITSPEHPMYTFKRYNKSNDTWEAREDIEQLLRRIETIREFPEDENLTELTLL